MPNRRTFELIIITSMLIRPVFGSVRLWSVRTMQETRPGSALHTAAEVLSILT